MNVSRSRADARVSRGDVDASCAWCFQDFLRIEAQDVVLLEEVRFVQEFADENVEVPRQPALHEGIHLLQPEDRDGLVVSARVGVFGTDGVVAKDNPRLQVAQRTLHVSVLQQMPESGDEMCGVRPLLFRERLVVEASDEIIPVDGHYEPLRLKTAQETSGERQESLLQNRLFVNAAFPHSNIQTHDRIKTSSPI